MSDFDLEAEVSFLKQLLVPAPEGAATLDEVIDGFTPERAQSVLDSPELLEHLLRLTDGVAPGSGWVKHALSQRGPSRVLLEKVLMNRPDEDTVVLQVRDTAAGLWVGPSWLLDADEQALARLELPGGWIGWSVRDLATAPLVQLDRPERGLPSWVTEVAGEGLAHDLRERKSSSTWDGLMDEPHPVARYALGCWLEQHQPTPVALPVLRLELGALAHQFKNLVPDEVAEQWLRPLGGVLLRLHAQIRMWSEGERRSAERTLATMRSAFLATCPDAPEADAVAMIQAIPWPDVVRSDYALAAGGDGFEGSSAGEDLLAAVAEYRDSVLADYLAFPEQETDDPERPFLAEILAHKEGVA